MFTVRQDLDFLLLQSSMVKKDNAQFCCTLQESTVKHVYAYMSRRQINIIRELTSAGIETLQMWTALLVAGSIQCISGERVAPGGGT
jgi:hypothetical protein